MKNNTIWLDNITFSKPIKVNKNDSVDVLIIGGGITGLSTAYHLINSKLKVCVIEKNLIAHAISARTTGKLTYLQDNIYSKLKNNAHLYLESQLEAMALVEKIINDNNINCDYKKVDSYLYATNDKEIKKIKEEEKILKKLGINYKKYNKLPIKNNALYSISVSDTAVFHPIKYLIKLKEIITNNGINVYENSCVDELDKHNDGYICTVNGKNIKARKVIIATHYPFFIYPYFLPLKTSLEKSYISATRIKNPLNFSAITISNPFESIRYHSDNNNSYYIYLNGSHNLCTKYNYKDNFECLIKELNKYKLTPQYVWSNHDILTEDSMPYIGYIDDNLLIGTGYNTWGMTNGSLAGQILSDLVQNKDNKYKKIFNPKRTKSFTNTLKYPLDMSYSAKSFIQNKISKNKSWYTNNVKFTTIDSKEVGIYTDENKKEHIVYNICPHMKCSLIFNEEEKTWDCPCHGSRFDIDGKSICGPSNNNIGYKKDNN